jgi:putative ABC transport system ATP-binding protein
VTTVRLEDVTLRVGDRVLVEGVTLEASSGDRVALTGRSGSGKTSLLRAVSGVVAPSGGRVVVQPSSAHVALVPQEPVLVAALTVEENLEVFLRAAGVAPEDVAARAAAVVDTFRLGKVADRLALELSGGEQQRLAIARVAALRPDVLLVDEPTARQDAESRAWVIAGLLEASRDGVLVMATHDPEVAAVCDHVVAVAT